MQVKKVHYITLSGSLYEVDDVAKTWRRLVHGEKSGELRTEEGKFEGRNEPAIGDRLLLFMPTLNGDRSRVRTISTSPVMQIVAQVKEDVTDGPDRDRDSGVAEVGYEKC